MADHMEKLAAWMKNVMAVNEWSAKDWAMRADTSPTTITRFLCQKKHVPSGKTLNKLATAARSTPPIGVDPQTYATIPLFKVGMDVMNNLSMDKVDDVIVDLDVSASAIAVKLDTDSMTLGGLLPSDTLICEPIGKLKPKTGSVVAFYDVGVSAGRYFPPFIIPASSNVGHKPVDFGTVEVIGKVVQQIRMLE